MQAGTPPLLPLTASEESRVLDGIDRFVELARDVARLAPADGEDTPEIADRLIRWWLGLSPTSRKPPRPEQGDIAWAVGCAVGDFLYHVLEVRWKKIVQGTQTHLCLHGYRPAKGPANPAASILITPIDDVMERWPKGPEDSHGPISEYVEDLYENDLVRSFIAEGDD